MRVHITNETSRLRKVILGIATSNGPVPWIDEAYDPKSIFHIRAGTYPQEADMVAEIEAFCKVLKKHGVTVFRPECIEDYNQIFARDIGLVIDDQFIIANILPKREKEINALHSIVNQIDPQKIHKAPSSAIHFEGGDIIVHPKYLFIGTYTANDYADCIVARTNQKGIDYLASLFPDRIVKAFDLRKSITNPYENALHLDCCFQPVGVDRAILYREGFRNAADYEFLLDFFGKDKIFHITQEEMYHMQCNIFSIAEDIVVSEKKFHRLNSWLTKAGIFVETIPYSEIAKQQGLLRCSTLPLYRD